MRISDWSSDVCSSDLAQQARAQIAATLAGADTIRSQVTEQDSSIRQARAQLAAQRAAPDLANEQLARYRPLAATGAEPRTMLQRSEEHTSERQLLNRLSYDVFRPQQHTYTQHQTYASRC